MIEKAPGRGTTKTPPANPWIHAVLQTEATDLQIQQAQKVILKLSCQTPSMHKYFQCTKESILLNKYKSINYL